MSTSHLHAGLLFALSLLQVLCMLLHLLGLHTFCNCSIMCLETTVFTASGSIVFHMETVPETLDGKECDTNVPFRTEHSAVTYSLHGIQLWVSLCSYSRVLVVSLKECIVWKKSMKKYQSWQNCLGLSVWRLTSP